MTNKPTLAQQLAKRGEIHNDFRFSVKIDEVNLALFTEFSLPTLTLETDTWQEGGQNTFSHKLPKRVDTGNVRLKHGMTTSMELLKWYIDVLNGDMRAGYGTRQVTVELIAPQGYAVIVWTFRDAFPVKWTGPQLKSDAAGITIDEIELAYHGFDVTTGDAIPDS